MIASKKTIGQIARYTAVTFQSAAITLGMPWLLHTYGSTPEKLAVGIAFITAFFINFFVLKLWVFRSKNQTGAQLLKFALTSALFRATEYSIFFILFEFAALNYLLAVFLVLSISFVLKFIVQKRLIFK